ncbi:FtsL-like putative cell division protein [Porphyromonas sp.]|uniref:FtsL-like putative cell division protein n=1 Tax=Porphyromonas sp. TaxID=1924944 RepID=UPI0026DC968A|nr:FtsL-like putative cell division protein [Porphyromonas sp.]MDO4770627.1 FtsL-like putative cell division protein [Porphyromonas sp.]
MAIENTGTEKAKKLWRYLGGEFLSDGFQVQNLKWIVAATILALVLIANNYTAIRKLRKINNLKREITDLRMEEVSISSTLMGATRISAIEERVKEENLEISIPKTPPIIIEK